jgi:serine protease Do
MSNFENLKYHIQNNIMNVALKTKINIMPKNNKQISFKVVVAILAIAILGGVTGSALTVKILNLSTSGQINEESVKIIEKQVYVEESQVVDTVKEISPSVVSIVITKDLPLYRNSVFSFNDPLFNDSFFNDSFFNIPFGIPQYERDENGNVRKERTKVGGGSGFIVSEDGLVVTNRHVVDDPEANYTVILNDGTEHEAESISTDNINDVAVLKIKDKNGESIKGLHVAKLGNSDEIQVGQRVIAIGNALAEYKNTVTTGVISAKERSIEAGSIRSTESLVNLIQTDAAINPGNSGGPLVNLNGQVIGINTAIAAGAQGIGFAIPINDILSIIESVKEHGKIVRPFLGIRFMIIDKEKADELKIDVEGGALLVGNESEGEFAVIPGSPADKAGLKIKDVILEVNGEKVTMENQLHMIIAKYQPGNEIAMKVWRSGEKMEIRVILEESE